MKYFLIFLFLIGFSVPAYAQYIGNSSNFDTLLDVCIGGPGMCPSDKEEEKIDNDQNNALLVLTIGIPFLAMIGFLFWRKRT